MNELQTKHVPQREKKKLNNKIQNDNRQYK